MNLLSLSLAVWCSLLLGYMFIVSPVHGREVETKLNRAEIQSLKELMALTESTGDNLVDEQMKRMRSPSSSISPPPVNRRGTQRGGMKRARTRDVPFDRRSSRLLCERRNPLAGYSGVPQTLKKDVDRFLDTRVADVNCGQGIRLMEIMKIANSIADKNIFPVHGRGISYSYLPNSRTCRGRFYESGHNKCDNKYTCKRNFKDSEMYLLYDCPNVQEYWSGWTPCYFCEQSLMDWKEDTNHGGTVTIHVGKMYNWGNKRSTPECLALMIRQGFDLVPWDWSTFQRQMRFSDRSACQNLLDLIQMCDEFDDAYTAIERVINDAQDLANRHSTRELDGMCRL